MSILQVDTCR